MKRRSKQKCRKCVIGKGKLWDGIKNVLKKTKILSSAAKFIPGVGPILSNVVSNVGYGRTRRHRKHRGGMANPNYKSPPKQKWNTEMFHKVYGNKTGLLKKVGKGKKRRSFKSGNNVDNRFIDNKIRVL